MMNQHSASENLAQLAHIKAIPKALSGIKNSQVPKVSESNAIKPPPRPGQSLPPLENGPYIKNGKPNGRPGPFGKARLAFEWAVYNKQVGSDGILRDPNTGEVINWKPGQPRKGVVDFGHIEGKAYRDEFKKYKNREITLNQLKEFQSDPSNFQIELPSNNRSGRFE